MNLIWNRISQSTLNERELFLIRDDGGLLFVAEIEDNPDADEIARRIVACWNACVGTSTDELIRQYNKR